jgi:putrescine aminotransferase
VADKKARGFYPDPGTAGTHCRNYCFASGLIMRAIRDTMVCARPFLASEADELVAKAKAAIDRMAKDYGKM